jgi:hypothetical protein
MWTCPSRKERKGKVWRYPRMTANYRLGSESGRSHELCSFGPPVNTVYTDLLHVHPTRRITPEKTWNAHQAQIDLVFRVHHSGERDLLLAKFEAPFCQKQGCLRELKSQSANHARGISEQGSKCHVLVDSLTTQQTLLCQTLLCQPTLNLP